MSHHFFPTMDARYHIVFSINGNVPIECPIITAKQALGIAECGQCPYDKANAILSLSTRNELVIEKTGHADVMLTRSGRNYHLKPGKPISLFKNDSITIGGSNIHIVKASLTHSSLISKPSYRRLPSHSSASTYLRILSTIAAMFTLYIANNTAYAQTPDNTTVPQVIRPAENNSLQKQILKHFEILKPKISQHADNIDPKNNKADTNVRKTKGCEEGNKICLSNNRYECINHRWKLVKACQRPTHCTTGDSYCDGDELCKNGKYLCDDDEIYKCIDGKWTINERCEHSEACEFPAPGFFDWLIEPEPKCVEVEELEGEPAEGDECEEPQMKCESNAVMACRYGFWEYVEICENRMQCQMISDVNAKCVERRTMGRIIPEGHIVR